MRRTEITFGLVVLGLGLLFLIGALFKVDIWGLICPVVLIGVGIVLIYRTRQDPSSGNLKIRFVGDIRRGGVWLAQDEEIWGFVLDTRLDFTEADLEDGETTLRIGAFVNDFRVTVPEQIGIAVQSMAFMTESRILGEKQETFFIPFQWQSPNFEASIKKIVLKPTCFVSEIRIEQVHIDAQ